jgi:hypothetical protein
MAASYIGATAASSIANPPVELLNALGGAGNSITPGTAVWRYTSTNTATEFTTSNFFTDGYQLGMKVGDIVFCVYQTSVGSTSPIPYMGCVAVSSTSGVTLASATS